MSAKIRMPAKSLKISLRDAARCGGVLRLLMQLYLRNEVLLTCSYRTRSLSAVSREMPGGRHRRYGMTGYN